MSRTADRQRLSMDQAPLVSILINNYNYGSYVGAAIESALGQSYPRVEVIVVDDGSTDHSRQVISKYAQGITPILKENGGQASALNAGFARSCGDFLIFLDADDVLLPEAAQRVADVFQEDPLAAKVMYRLEVIDAQGNRTGILKPHGHLSPQQGDLRQHELCFPFDLTWMATSGNAFSAPVLRQIFPIPERVYGQVGADWYLSHVAPLFGTVRFIPEVHALYRVHDLNCYELSKTSINLDHIRHTLHYAAVTRTCIHKYAGQLSLAGRPAAAEDILSVSYQANRLISWKFEPQQSPSRGESAGRLFRLGAAAACRRFDISWPMKILLILWFAAMALAPRRLARPLAESFTFPEKREKLNGILSRLHRSS